MSSWFVLCWGNVFQCVLHHAFPHVESHVGLQDSLSLFYGVCVVALGLDERIVINYLFCFDYSLDSIAGILACVCVCVCACVCRLSLSLSLSLSPSLFLSCVCARARVCVCVPCLSRYFSCVCRLSYINGLYGWFVSCRWCPEPRGWMHQWVVKSVCLMPIASCLFITRAPRRRRDFGLQLAISMCMHIFFIFVEV